MCKCGANTHQDHTQRVSNGYPGHVYKGRYWAPTDDQR